jgi:hypothetical protein
MPNVSISSQTKKQQAKSTGPTVYIDIDDTCLDLLGGYVNWLFSSGRLNVSANFAPVPIKDRNRVADWLGIDESLEQQWHKEFVCYSWQWGALKGLPDSGPALSLLKNAGWKIWAVGKGHAELARATLRRANLELIYPGIFEDMFLLPEEKSFYPYFSDKEEAVVISSMGKNSVDVAECSHRSFLLSRPWNQGFSDIRVKRYDNWLDIATSLTNR